MEKSNKFVDIDGSESWYYDGMLHRNDGPAWITSSGSKHWYISDQRHRDDGPAIEYSNGNRAWYSHGMRHRLDGPAIERASDGINLWYIYHVYYPTVSSYIEYLLEHELITIEDAILIKMKG